MTTKYTKLDDDTIRVEVTSTRAVEHNREHLELRKAALLAEIFNVDKILTELDK